MFAQLRTAILMLICWTVITGLAYPLVMTGISQAVFPKQANGSLVERDGHVVGSELIGQSFDDPKYFWGRPSATMNIAGTVALPYNAAASSGSNRAVGNPSQLDAVKARVEALKAADPSNSTPVPVDLVTASGSGLDPHISIAAADFQAERIARLRAWSSRQVRDLIAAATEPRQFGLLGEPRVNVLKLNLELDRGTAASQTSGRRP